MELIDTKQEPDIKDKLISDSYKRAIILAKELGEDRLCQQSLKNYMLRNNLDIDSFPEEERKCLAIAKDKIIKLLAKPNKSPNDYSMLGHLYTLFGDYSESFKNFSIARKKKTKKELPIDNYHYACALQYFNNQHDTIMIFRSLNTQVKNYGFRKDYLYRIAIISRKQKNYEKALMFIHHCRDDPPYGLSAAEMDFQFAYTLQIMGLHSRAREAYEVLIKQHPNNINVLVHKLYASFLEQNSLKKPNNQQIISDANTILKLFPNVPLVNFVCGRIFMVYDMHSEAYDQLSKCTAYFNENPYYWWLLGIIYFVNEQYPEAYEAFNRAIRLKKDITNVWYNLIVTLEVMKRKDIQRSVIESARTNVPNFEKLEQKMVGYKPATIIDIDSVNIIQNTQDEIIESFINLPPKIYSCDIDLGFEIPDGIFGKPLTNFS